MNKLPPRQSKYLIGTLFWVASAAAVLSQTSLPAKTGPEVGSAVSEFSAPDQNGSEQTMRSILGPKGALLVFYRSADW